MKLSNWIKYGIAGIVTVLLLLRGCDYATEKGWLGKSSNSSIDTVTVTVHKTDTIFAKDTIYIPKLVPHLVYTTTPTHTISTEDCNTLRTYRDTTDDERITIATEAVVQGRLESFGLAYKLKVPLIIRDSTIVKQTITKTDSVTTRPKSSISVGGVLGYKETAPFLFYASKRHEFGIGYNLQTSKPIEGVRFMYKYNLWKSKR